MPNKNKKLSEEERTRAQRRQRYVEENAFLEEGEKRRRERMEIAKQLQEQQKDLNRTFGARQKQQAAFMKRRNQQYEKMTSGIQKDLEAIDNQPDVDPKTYAEPERKSDQVVRPSDVYGKSYAYLLNKKETNDPARYYDKGMLELFLRQSMKYLHQESASIGLTPLKNAESFNRGLRSEDNGGPDESSRATDSLLRGVLNDVYLYTQIDISGKFSQYFKYDEDTDFRQLEERLVHRIYRRLSLLNDRFNAQIDEYNNLKDEKQKDEKFKSLPSDEYIYSVSNMLNYFQGELFGRLGDVPDQPVDENAPHINYSGKFLENSAYTRDLSADVIKELKASNEKIKKTLSGAGDNDFSDSDDTNNPNDITNIDKYKLELDRRNAPLFPHDPCYDDVQQGHIGDCYLLCTLGSIAYKKPDKIKEMLHDNQDGTVTVRFFRHANATEDNAEQKYEPYYVTVDKITTKGQNQGPLWVQMIERALAVSGYQVSYYLFQNNRPVSEFVPSDIDEIYGRYKARNERPDPVKYPWITDADGNLKKWEPNLYGISGGTSRSVMEFLFGENQMPDEISTPGFKNKKLIPQTDADVKPIDITKPYTSTDKKIRDFIKEHQDHNHFLTASTHPYKDGDSSSLRGITRDHAYTVLGIMPQKFNLKGKIITRYFVKIRDPHGWASNREYHLEKQNGKQMLVAEGKEYNSEPDSEHTNGVSLVELSDFVKEFSSVYAFSVKESVVDRNKRLAKEEKSVLGDYQQAFKDVADYLRDNARIFNTSPAYAKLYETLLNMDGETTMFGMPFSSYKSLRTKVSKLEKNIDAYLVECHDLPSDSKNRKAKIKACKMLRGIIASAKKGFERPTADLKKTAARKLVDDFIKASEGKPELREEFDYATNHPEDAVKQVQNSAKFQKWAAKYSSHADLFVAASDKNFTYSNIIGAPITIPGAKDREMTTLGSRFLSLNSENAVTM